MSNARPSELDSSKGDLNNSSHYYRFKRHSLGYQSQGPAMTNLKGTLINIEAMNPNAGGREQSQTASGAGAFNNNRMKGIPHGGLNHINVTNGNQPTNSISFQLGGTSAVKSEMSAINNIIQS